MAKRFTDNSKWKKLWIRRLEPKYKLFWFYLLDNCDHAGIYDADIESASFHIGLDYSEEEILQTFDRKIKIIKKDKWFIPKFVEYQYGELNENNRAHLSVIKILKKYNLLDANNTLVSTLQGSKLKDKDKVKIKVKDKAKSYGDKKAELVAILVHLDDLQSDFPTVNVKLEYEKFVDYLESNGKKYKNYIAAFRNWLRNDNFGKATIEPKKVVRSVDVICSECDYAFKQKSGVKNSSRCPKCNEHGVMDAITYNLMRQPNA
jgi:hypothetical protein